MVLPHTRFPQPHFLRYPRRKNRSVRKLLNTHAHRLRIHAPRLKRRLKHGINRSFRKSLPQEKMEWTEKRFTAPQKPISLDSLKSKPSQVVTQGKKSPEPSKNISGLKAALAEVLKVEKKETTVTPPAPQKRQEVPSNSHNPASGQKQNDIPEDELRKMLQVDN